MHMVAYNYSGQSSVGITIGLPQHATVTVAIATKIKMLPGITVASMMVAVGTRPIYIIKVNKCH